MWTAREPWLATVRHGCAGRRQHSDAEGRPAKSSLLVGGPGRLHGVIHWQSSSRRERRAQRPRPAEAADHDQYPRARDTCSPFVGIPWHFQASTLGVDTSIPIGEVQVSTLSVDAPGLFL